MYTSAQLASHCMFTSIIIDEVFETADFVFSARKHKTLDLELPPHNTQSHN